MRNPFRPACSPHAGSVALGKLSGLGRFPGGTSRQNRQHVSGVASMKGPGNRIDLDVRRLWKCPRCGDERKASGDIAAKPCARPECGGTWMKLVEPLRKPVLRYTPPPHEPIPDDPDPAPRTASGGENAPRPSRKQRRDVSQPGSSAEQSGPSDGLNPATIDSAADCSQDTFSAPSDSPDTSAPLAEAPSDTVAQNAPVIESLLEGDTPPPATELPDPSPQPESPPSHEEE